MDSSGAWASISNAPQSERPLLRIMEAEVTYLEVSNSWTDDIFALDNPQLA